MATISTTSVYTSQINEFYPTAGQNNTTQGLRDNFKNIKNALYYADADITNLKLNSVNIAQLGNATNNFNYNTIQNAILKGVADRGVDNSTGNAYNGDIQVDFTQGAYQKYNLAGGIHTISVINWPTTTETNGAFRASVVLYFTANSLDTTYVSFPSSYTNIGPGSLPYQIGPAIDNSGPWLFEVTYDGSFTAVRQLTEYSATTATNTSTTVINIGKNFYTTGSNAETVVTFNNQYGSVALLPTVITSNVMQVITPSNQVTLDSVTNIAVGATIFSPNSTAVFTVQSVNTATKTIVTNESIGSGIVPATTLEIVNPKFTNQPTVLQLSTTLPTNGTISSVNELKGTLYTDGTVVYVAYQDYAYNITNKILISGDQTPNPRALGNASTATTQFHADQSNLVATTQFVYDVVFDSTTTVNSSTYSLQASTSTNAEVVTGLTSNGYGTRTVSYGGPTGGSDGDIWYQII